MGKLIDDEEYQLLSAVYHLEARTLHDLPSVSTSLSGVKLAMVEV
jgi:hypothetical protein